MAKPIEYLDGARIDFDESFDWYAQRSAGAAIGFASAVDNALGTILKDPGRFPQTHGGCTYCALKRFPFRIVFRMRNAGDAYQQHERHNMMTPRQQLTRRWFLGATAATAGGVLIPAARGLGAKPAVTPSEFPATDHFWYRPQPAGPFVDSQRDNKAFGFADGTVFLSEDKCPQPVIAAKPHKWLTDLKLGGTIRVAVAELLGHTAAQYQSPRGLIIR